MKNRNSLLVALMLIGGLLMQPSMTISGERPGAAEEMMLLTQLSLVGTVAMAAGMTIIGFLEGAELGQMVEGRINIVTGYVFAAYLLHKVREMVANNRKADYKFKTELPRNEADADRAIYTKIVNLINMQSPQTKEGKSGPMFPTNKSKIFVLQNIGDFFNLYDKEKTQQSGIFSDLVYKNCMKLINELERSNERDKKYFSERYAFNEQIDNDRQRYMNKYELFGKDLVKMSSDDLTKKIGLISEELERKKDDIIKMDTKQGKSRAAAEWSALLSILYYLTAKQEGQKEMLDARTRATGQQAKSQHYAYVKALQYLPSLGEGEKPYTEWEVEQRRRKILAETHPFIINKPATAENIQQEQSSVMSKIRSWWNSWWR